MHLHLDLNHIHLVEDTTQVDELPEFDAPIAMLAQTTLSHRDWQGVLEATRERFPDVWMPGRSDLCFATTNRQSALSAIAERCDAVIVIGSANSSNTMALAQLAESSGCPHVYRINSADELPSDLQGIVGVTAGASAPEELIDEIVNFLQSTFEVELYEDNLIEENVSFRLPNVLNNTKEEKTIN